MRNTPERCGFVQPILRQIPEIRRASCEENKARIPISGGNAKYGSLAPSPGILTLYVDVDGTDVITICPCESKNAS